MPPTAQNQPSIEADLMAVAVPLVLEPDDVIRSRCEQSIRNYDPVYFVLHAFPQTVRASSMKLAPARKVLVVGLGNPDRGDDGVGPLVAKELSGVLPTDVAITWPNGDVLSLIVAWSGFDAVIFIDAAAPARTPGASIASISQRPSYRGG